MKSTVVSVESKAKVPIRIQRQVLSLGSLLSYVLFHQTGLEGGWFAMNLGSESLALKYAKAGRALHRAVGTGGGWVGVGKARPWGCRHGTVGRKREVTGNDGDDVKGRGRRARLGAEWETRAKTGHLSWVWDSSTELPIDREGALMRVNSYWSLSLTPCSLSQHWPLFQSAGSSSLHLPKGLRQRAMPGSW